MTKEEFIAEHLKLAELKWTELELGEQLVKLTVEQKKAHNDVRLQRDRVEDL